MNLSKEILSSKRLERIAAPEPTLPPGSLIFWVCDGTDNDPYGGITNGVKRTQLEVTSQLQKMGYHVMVVYPKMPSDSSSDRYFRLLKSFAGYDGFDVAINPQRVWELIGRFKPDGVMVSTLEGPLGQAVALVHNHPEILGLASRDDFPYLASFTTRVDMFAAQAINHQWQKMATAIQVPGSIPNIVSPSNFESMLNMIYGGAEQVLVPTQTMLEELKRMGMPGIEKKGVVWPRGINEKQWRLPELGEKNPYHEYEWFSKHPDWPVILYFGRVSVEKNIDSMFSAGLEEVHLVVIGEGPYLEELAQKNPTVHFLGKMHAEQLSSHVRFAGAHIFTSLTDTFGNTLLEAGASGVPTIGYSGVPGPQDVIVEGVNGFLVESSSELAQTLPKALKLDRASCSSDIVSRFSWSSAAKKLLLHLPPTAFFNQREIGHLEKQFR